MKLDWGGIEQVLGNWYIYVIRSGDECAYVGMTTRPAQRLLDHVQFHAQRRGILRKVGEWIKARNGDVTMCILESYSKESRARVGEKRAIGNLDPLLNDKPGAKRRGFVIEVDTQWDRKYWFNAGE